VQSAIRNSQTSSGRAAIPAHSSMRWNAATASTKEKDSTTSHDPEAAMRILIVDRDSMSSNLLADTLNRSRNCSATVFEPQNLFPALGGTGAALVIVGSEIHWKSGGSFELVQKINQTYPNVQVVMLLTKTSREMIIHAFRAGARGVFSRHEPISDFLDCIDHVCRGFLWVGRRETDYLLDAFKSIPAPAIHAAADSPSLSVRELQVVKCAAEGKTNRAIAAELRLSEHTVKNYLFKAFDKLRVSSRVELLFYLTVQGHTFGTPTTIAADEGQESGSA
jgi:two-component system nitrate/nitrite response regulator NarL